MPDAAGFGADAAAGAGTVAAASAVAGTDAMVAPGIGVEAGAGAPVAPGGGAFAEVAAGAEAVVAAGAGAALVQAVTTIINAAKMDANRYRNDRRGVAMLENRRLTLLLSYFLELVVCRAARSSAPRSLDDLGRPGFVLG